MMPRPPAWAMAMASRASVTVSIAAEMMGMERLIARVSRVAVETWAGSTEDAPGFISTSSKVRYSGMMREDMCQPFGRKRISRELAAVLNTVWRQGARQSCPLPLAVQPQTRLIMSA